MERKGIVTRTISPALRRWWFAALALTLCPRVFAQASWIEGEWQLTFDDLRDGSLAATHVFALVVRTTADGFAGRPLDAGDDAGIRGQTWEARGVILVAFTQLGPDGYRVFSGSAVDRDLFAGTYYGVGNGPPGTSGEWRLERSLGLGREEPLDEYLGCFRDQSTGSGTEGRDLQAMVWKDHAMTPRRCADLCRGQGFGFAGLQYGKYCFCDDRHGGSGPADNCDMACVGDPTEICGGQWANSVYKLGAAGAPIAPRACAAALATVHAWAEAWSSQDVERYLGYYDREFSPPGGLSHERWRAERRQRLERPEYIGVEIIAPEVKLCEDDRATLVFTQSYFSDRFRDWTRKELRLYRLGEQWKIAGERALE